MKWVKVAIGAVIAIAVVPMIAISVNNLLTQETRREEVVTFELLSEGTLASGAFDELYNSLPDTPGGYYQPVDVLYDDTLYNGTYNKDSSQIELYVGVNDDYIIIYPNDTWLQEDPQDFTFTVGDTFEIIFEVEQPLLSGINATLLLLAPLVFVSGVLFYIYNKQEGI